MVDRPEYSSLPEREAKGLNIVMTIELHRPPRQYTVWYDEDLKHHQVFCHVVSGPVQFVGMSVNLPGAVITILEELTK